MKSPISTNVSPNLLLLRLHTRSGPRLIVRGAFLWFDFTGLNWLACYWIDVLQMHKIASSASTLSAQLKHFSTFHFLKIFYFENFRNSETLPLLSVRNSSDSLFLFVMPTPAPTPKTKRWKQITCTSADLLPNVGTATGQQLLASDSPASKLAFEQSFPNKDLFWKIRVLYGLY